MFLFIFPFFILFLLFVFNSLRVIHSSKAIANTKGSKMPGTANSKLATPELAGWNLLNNHYTEKF